MFKYTDTHQLFPAALGEKTVEQQNITKETFQQLFKSLEYKNGLRVANSISKDFIGLYETIKTKPIKIIELIDIELNS